MKKSILFKIVFVVLFAVCFYMAGCGSFISKAFVDARPNVIIILTDDQGYGDLGCHGNTKISTPALDSFASESVEFTHFFVSPVCAPTRSSLMTGRYNYRTKVTDTWKGRSLIDPQEVTLAEVMKKAGYKTGIFGKWHLGDNYPMRAIDQGFDEAIVHRGGGLAQPSCPKGNGYFDPILMHNGKPEKYHGYCMDIYTDAALNFVETNQSRPFFLYLATNTPHTPLQISEEYVKPYLDADLEENTAKLYGMVTNIDDNLRRLLAKLDEIGLAENTLIVFMSDNGPEIRSKDRYSAGLRDSKGSVYENGIRVPCFVRWGEKFPAGKKVDTLAAHIDIMPTVIEACNIAMPFDIAFDGMSLLPLLNDAANRWPDRNLYFQWHRGDVPQKYRCFAVRNERYKFLQSREKGNDNHISEDKFKFELYDIANDPYEKHDISNQFPQIASEMKENYAKWFDDVCSTRGFDTPEIVIGSEFENPSVLTHEDRKNANRWGSDQYFDAYWCVKFVRDFPYTVKVKLYESAEADGKLCLSFCNQNWSTEIEKGQTEYILPEVWFPVRSGRLKVWLDIGGKKICPHLVEISY